MSQVAKQSTKYLEWLEYLVSLHLKEDYETLRHEAQELKADMRVDAATRALGVFFFEHTSAYVRWIITYDYELIRNREERACAALREKYWNDFPEADREAIVVGLSALALLVIEGTHIENGMIASDPVPMFEHSQKLEQGLDAALDTLLRWKNAHDLLTKEPAWLRAVNLFISEIEWRRAVNNGTKEYARLLIHFPYNRDYFLANVGEVERHLDEILNRYTRDHFETCSDLRAHKEFLRHQRLYLEKATSTPYFRNTHLVWLLNFQIDRALASWLCEQLAPTDGEDEDEDEDISEEDEEQEEIAKEDAPAEVQEEEDAEDAAQQLALANEHERFRRIWHRSVAGKRGNIDRRWKRPHIEHIEAQDNEDYLETGFSEHEMHSCTIMFRPVRTHLVSLADVAQSTTESAADEIEMTLKIYAYGICTIEFSIEGQDLDIFQLRQVSALIAPFAHKSTFTWYESHLRSESVHATHHDESQLEPLAENIFNGLKTAVKSYLHSHILEVQGEIREVERTTRALGHPELDDDATAKLDRLKEQLRKLGELRDHARDKNNWIYLPHLNWYTYANPREMTRAQLVDPPSGEKVMLPSPLGSFDIDTLPEFQGLVLPLREKRASLHDWLAMRKPEKRNLAEITSHTDDLFYVSTHSALLYFPDDPNFNVLQFVELVATATRLYCLVTSMVARSKREFDELAELEEKAARVIAEPDRQGIADRDELLEEIRIRQTASEHFDSDARRSLDLLTLRIVSRYSDTTRLMQAMTDELDIMNLRQLFDETMARVNQKRDNLSSSVERLQEITKRELAEKEAQEADRKERERQRLADARAKRLEDMQKDVDARGSNLSTVAGIAAALLAVAGVDVIITDFQNAFAFLPDWLPSWTPAVLHLLAIVVIIVIVMLILLGQWEKFRVASQKLDAERAKDELLREKEQEQED
ncbi:MAG TPA: hypothetical protein VKT82_29500 [Ktedonobacterales bacterium]|nr:hypothetical protein [Ktedonobacterales bacterium]